MSNPVSLDFQISIQRRGKGAKKQFFEGKPKTSESDVSAGRVPRISRFMALAIYFEERNVHPQCAECNLTLQGNQYRYAIFLLKTYGPTILEELDAQRKQGRQIKEAEYIDLIAEYQDKQVFHDLTRLADTPWGTREFAFYDPDGNGLTFYRDLKKSEARS